MSWIAICNIIIVNIIVLLALSYFWSGWNFKVFKPWLWLEQKKRNQLQKDIESAERNMQDKNRFYAHWFALEQIDGNHVKGDIVIAGLEDIDLALICNRHSPERNLIIVDEFEDRKVEIVRENCQGEVTRQSIDIKSVDIELLKEKIGTQSNSIFLKGKISEELSSINNYISFAVIDCVDYDNLSNSLNYLYNLLSEGGILLVHDYNHNWDSVRSAIDKFEAGVKEKFLWLPDMYGSVALVKNSMR